MRSLSRYFALASLCFAAALAGCSGSGPSASSPTPTPTPPTSAALTITSVAPTKVPAGSAAFALTVNGTGFVSTTQLQVGGATVPSTYVSSTQLTATVPAKTVNNGAQLAVVAANGAVMSANEASAVKLEVDNPVPQISGFSPTGLVAGAGSSTLSVTGTGFVPSTVIQVNGSTRPTGFVSSTQVNLTVTDADLATGGALGLMAFNPAPAGGSSAAASVPVNFPAPGSITLSPSTVAAGATDATSITVTGTNFVKGSVAQVNGGARPTVVISSTQLTFMLSVADQSTQGTAAITVSNPQPGGGTSAAAVLTLTPPAPTPSIHAILPAQLTLNTPTTITVTGDSLQYTSTVTWNGQALATTFVPYSCDSYYSYSCTYNYLTATVPAELLTSVGSAQVAVTDTASPKPSNALTVQIVNPVAPTVTGVNPSNAVLNTASALTVNGSGFTTNSTIQVDGTALATTFQDAGTLTATLPASGVAIPGVHTVTVSTPAPGGGTATGVPFTAYVGLPNTAMALNPVNGLLYVSVPSSAGAPYGNSIVSVDPATGAIGKPIPVGSEPGKLAISSDGTTAWVGLDAASAVRMVDLTKGVAGLQFSIATSQSYTYSQVYGQAALHAIAVLPGSKTSIAVLSPSGSYSYSDNVTIYDDGVARTNQGSLAVNGGQAGIYVSATKPELYVYSYSGGYQALRYDANGLTQLASNNSLNTTYINYGGAVQVDGGRAYLDSGQVLDAEAGTLLGTFYSGGTTQAYGPMVSDSSVGKDFIVSGSSLQLSYQPITIQAYKEADQTLIPGSSLTFSGAISATKYTPTGSVNSYQGSAIDTLVRWGQNGLALRGSNGIFSFRTDMVRDLSTTTADLQVTASSPAAATTGSPYSVSFTVTNNGPSAASDVALTGAIPANVSVVSAGASKGSCAVTTTLSCDLGTLASSAAVTVTLQAQGIADGDAVFSATAQASESDSQSSNNSASTTTTLSGGAVALVPTITTVSPSTALAGSQDLQVTISGTGFTSASAANLGGTALSTSFVSGTQLTATVPATSMASLGWAPLTVSTPAPGGGVSNPLAFTTFNVVKLQANHIKVEPFTNRLYATVNSAATEVAGNTLVAIDPLTGSFGTPVNVGSQPSSMTVTDDGKVIYVAQTGASSVGRFNVGTQSLEFSFPVAVQQYFGTSAATVNNVISLPGSDTTVAVVLDSSNDTAIYDVDPAAQTAAARVDQNGQNSMYNLGSNLQFLNGMSGFVNSVGSLNAVNVTATGLTATYGNQITLNNFGTFHLLNGTGYADFGGVADLSVTPPVQKGVFLQLPSTISPYYNSYSQLTAADPSLGRSFFAYPSPSYSGDFSLTLTGFDQKSFVQTDQLTLPYSIIVNSSHPYSYETNIVDFVRWGQDGLALLLSDGQVALLRGAFVIPGLLTKSGSATLTSVSKTTIAHGSGNAVLSVTGSGFVPGAGVFWNGAYRTTTLVDGAHLSFDVPASDVATAGSAKVTVVNPNAAASSAITVTIQ